MIRRNFEIQHRIHATGPVVLDAGLTEVALEQARDVTRTALLLIAEDEERRLAGGERARIPLGAWLTLPTGSRAIENVVNLVETMIRMRLDPAETAVVFRTLTSVARHADRDRTRLLDDVAPRAQLLPPIVAAASAVDGLVGPVRAHALVVHTGEAGRDAQVYGVHKAEGAGAISRILGLAALGPDTLVPVTAHALITGTRDDPSIGEEARIAAGKEAMAACGLGLPRTLADHVGQHLSLLRSAHGVVAAAASGSRACGLARINPLDMLQVGFSPWLLLGHMHIGPRLHSRHVGAGKLVLPGLDHAVIEIVAKGRFQGLASAGDNAPAFEGAHTPLVYRCGGGTLHGPSLMKALFEEDVAKLPSMSEVPSRLLRLAEDEDRAAGIATTITSKYLVVAEGLELTREDGKPSVPVAAILRVDPNLTRMWTTTVDLSDPELLAAAISRLELHVHALGEQTLMSAVPQFFGDHDIHRLQASSYVQHMALRVVMMVANAATVGVARARQTGRGPTG